MNIDANLLLEWQYNDSNILIEDYFVLTDTRTTLNYFAANDSTGSVASNGYSEQLFPVNAASYLWDVINTTTYPFLKQSLYGAPPMLYDTLKVHIPMGFTLANYAGFMLSLQLVGNNGQNYTISNNFYDKANNLSRLVLNPQPFLYNGIQWGSYIEFQVPNGNAIVNQVATNNGVTTALPGSINYNLSNGYGISSSQPWRLLFYWINYNTAPNGPTYTVVPGTSWAIPLIPTYQALGIVFRDASDGGDYYEMFCTYNGSQSGFVDYMTSLENRGINNQVEFDIQQMEGGIITDQQNRVIPFGSPWDTIMNYRPIFQSTATVVEVVITATISNLTDGTSETRTASRIFTDSEVATYGINLSGINVGTIEQVRIYQNKKDNSTNLGQDIDFIDILNFDEWGGFYADNNAFESDDPDTVAAARKALKPSTNGISTIQVSTPVLVDKYFISSMSSNQTLPPNVWYGNGLLEILLYPSDNVIAFSFASNVSNTVTPYALPSNGVYALVFGRTISVPLYLQAGVINLHGGQLLFLLTSNQELQCETLYGNGLNQFVITLTTSLGITTTLYAGTFIPYNSSTYQSRQQKNITATASAAVTAGLTGVTTPTVSLADSTGVFVSPIANTKSC